MKYKFPFKRAIIVFSAILVYSFIFGVTGNCKDYENSKLAAVNNNNTSEENTVVLDTYLNNLESPADVQQVDLWKAQITNYEVFNEFSDETTVTTTTAATTTTTFPQTVVEIMPKTTQLQASETPPQSNPPQAHTDEITMKVKVNGKVVTMPAYDVLCSLVMQELNNAHTEALKAQAVASYTYYKYNESKGIYLPVNIKSMGDIYQSVKNAVSQVLGVAIYYNGSYINATYCASTGGATANCCDVWGGNLPYLVSVPSEYDSLSAGHYKYTKTLSAATVKQKVESACNITLPSDPTTWFEFLPADKGGVLDGNFVGKMLIHTSSGSTITTTGRKMRENIIGLSSAKFEITYSNGNFIFTSYGNGHGVGLSQIGADLYARNAGYTYDQILKHYYTGVEVK